MEAGRPTPMGGPAADLRICPPCMANRFTRERMADFRALLLTDVVDSTKLSEAIGDHAMA